MLIHVLVSRHEAVFEGSQIEGAGRRRRRYTQGAGRQDLLLGVDAHHKALAEETSGDRGCGAKGDPRQTFQEGSDAPKLAAKEHLEANDDLTLEEHREAFEEEEFDQTVFHLHQREGHSRPARWTLADQKKSPVAQEREEEARGLWRWLASRFDARRLVFVDESGFHTSMTRPRARAPRGKRAYGKVLPRATGARTPPSSPPRSASKEPWGSRWPWGGGDRRLGLREAYVERFLAPSLREGQVVVLDGLGAHRTEKVRELVVQARGADLVFLPSYSPDLNPIEEAFSKIKQLVRKAAGARTREALVEAIGRALAAVTPEDAAGWFAHAGYWPQDQPL